jgi:hypothetical protein
MAKSPAQGAFHESEISPQVGGTGPFRLIVEVPTHPGLDPSIGACLRAYRYQQSIILFCGRTIKTIAQPYRAELVTGVQGGGDRIRPTTRASASTLRFEIESFFLGDFLRAKGSFPICNNQSGVIVIGSLIKQEEVLVDSEHFS